MTDTPNEIMRVNQVVQVMSILFAEGVKVEDACERVGIKPSTYYYWVKRDPDALKAVKEFLSESRKYELSVLSASVSQLHLKLAHMALKGDIEPADRLRITKYLANEAEKLQRVYQVTGGSEGAADFLKEGPQLSKKESRFASISVTPDDDGGVKVDLYREDPVIDGELSEIDSLDEPE